MAILVQHLLLASLALILIFVISVLIRVLLPRDAVSQYRLQTLVVISAVFLLPMQFLVCESVFAPRREVVNSGDQLAARWLSNTEAFYKFDSTEALPNPLGTVPEHDTVTQGSLIPVVSNDSESNDVSAAPVPPTLYPVANWQITNGMIANCVGIVYLIGLFTSIMLLAFRVFATRKLVRESMPLTDGALSLTSNEILGEAIPVRVSNQVATPSCLMFPKPLILFPANQEIPLTPEQLRCVLLHERTHIQQRDWFVCAMERVLLMAMWFHPLARKLVNNNSRYRELSCDARVVKETKSPNTYAMAMLSCCQSSQLKLSRNRFANQALITGFNSMQQVKRRLEMLKYADQPTSVAKIALATLVSAMTLIVGSTFHGRLLDEATPASIRTLLTFVAPSVVASPKENEKDTDGDGLSDFQETHKYLTDPNKSDSDGDGIKDSDWRERREYQYTVRSVVQVLRPVTIDYLNDNYQDARVLDETPEYVELEVIHYPFNRVSESLGSDSKWRETTKQHASWTMPGPSSDWTPKMRTQLKKELLNDGIDVEKLSDRELVEKVSKWLCDRAKFVDGFTTFVTAWDESGKPYIANGLDVETERKLAKKGRTIEDQFEREVSAKGMFKHKRRGSCTSSAIYLNGCLKALGVPTRTILCIPLIDASDEREFDLIMNLENSAVRQHLLKALKPLTQSWASHTFNEVFVGNRWQRLNYNHLGQGIYDQQLFGLLTHVATFNDWADAKAHETIGKRQKTDGPNDVFGFRNPYSAISLRDEVGVHCEVQLPEVQPEKGRVVEKIYWTDDEALPADIRENCLRRGRFGFIAEVSGAGGKSELLEFMSLADLRVFMNPVGDDGHPQLKIGFDKGCFWTSNDTAYIYVGFGGADKRDLVKHIQYRFEPRDNSVDKGWQLSETLTAIRKKGVPK